MIRTIQLQVVMFFLLGVLTSCGGGSQSEPVPSPLAGKLISPANNSACLQGTSATGSSSSVVFKWDSARYATSYQLIIKNLTTQSTVAYNTTELTYTASLAMNTPYSWSVMAQNESGKTSGDTWKFYLSGSATVSIAPFAADLTAPAAGSIINSGGSSSVQVTFEWKGSDADNDIASYAVYLDNTNGTTQVVASQSGTTLTRSLTAGTIYYWKVVTTDKAGNTSESPVNVFRIN